MCKINHVKYDSPQSLDWLLDIFGSFLCLHGVGRGGSQAKQRVLDKYDNIMIIGLKRPETTKLGSQRTTVKASQVSQLPLSAESSIGDSTIKNHLSTLASHTQCFEYV